MATLQVRNFGPIKEIKNLDVRDFMIFIGPSASGKSTIIKLIYLFNKIDIIAEDLVRSQKTRPATGEDYLIKLNEAVVTSFQNYFHVETDKNFFVKFIFNSKDWLELKGGIDIKVNWNDNFIKIIKEQYDTIVEESKNSKNPLSSIKKGMLSFFYDTLSLDSRSLLIPAERGPIIDGDYFNSQIINDFDDFIRNVKSEFSASSFENRSDLKRIEIAKFIELRNRILKAKYIIKDDEEILALENSKTNIELIHASSGQQNTARIIVSLAYLLVTRNANYLAIEEPEMNIFPSYQDDLMKLISFFFNEMQVFSETQKSLPVTMAITTHSPYILTSLNNLIYAWQVGQKHPEEAAKLVPLELWLDPARVQAYFVENGAIRTLIDEETRLILAEEIDGASTKINTIFSALLDIAYSTQEEK